MHKQLFPVRHELKYYINPAELEILRARICPVMHLDSHCVNAKPYAVRSLYFDDIYDSAYFDKRAGVKDRDKYRIRIYNMCDDVIFLERKRKRSDCVQKDSVRITRRLAEQLIAGDARGLDRAENPLLRDMFVEMRTNILRARVLVDYMREAYTFPAETVRITFDTQLRTGLTSTDIFNPDVPTVTPCDEALEILEVKFDRCFPAHLQALLSDFTTARSAISKYVMCRRYT